MAEDAAPEPGLVRVTCNTTGETLSVCDGESDMEVLVLGDSACSGALVEAGADKDGDVDSDIVVVVDGVDDNDGDVLLYPGYTNFGGCTDVG